MTAKLGRDLLLRVDDGEGFKTVAGLRTKSVRMNATSVDVTDSGSQGWTELLPKAGIRSVAITGSGVFRSRESDAAIRAAFFAGEELDAEMVMPGFGAISAPIMVTSLTYGGTYKGEATFEIGLASTGPASFAAP